jgi:hypothetical protein
VTEQFLFIEKSTWLLADQTAETAAEAEMLFFR